MTDTMLDPTRLVPTVARRPPGEIGRVWAARCRTAVLDRLALVLVAATVAMLPALRPSGPGNSAPEDLLIGLTLLATVASLIAGRRSPRLPYAAPVLVLVLAGAVGGLLHERTSAAVLALAQDVLVLLWAAAIANAVRTPAALRTVVRTWAFSAVAWAVVLLVGVASGITALSGVSARTGSRAALTFGDANLAASYFVLSLLVVIAVRVPRARAWRWVASLVLMAAIFATGSLGALASLVTALVVLGVWHVARRAGIPSAVAVACLVVPAALLVLGAAYDAVATSARNPASFFHDSLGRTDSSVSSRGKILSEDLALFGRASVLGEGPTSTKRLLVAEQAGYVKEAHNDLLATATERGVLGVIGLALLVGTAARYARRAVARARSGAVADVIPVPEALAAALVAVAVSSLFYEVLHFRHVWALLGVVAAVALLGDR